MLRKFLLVLLFLVLSEGFVAAQIVVRRTESFTASSAGVTAKITAARPTFHRLKWNGEGTVSTCTVKVEQSSDGSAWSDLIAAQTCTSNGAAVAVSEIINYVRINVTVLTGGGILTVSYEGLSGDSCGILYRGNIRSITGADPAANVEWTETVPANTIWKVRSVFFTLVTDGNAANRQVSVQYTDGSNNYGMTGSHTNQAASSTFSYSAMLDVDNTGSTQLGVTNFALPNLSMPAGHIIRSKTELRQTGDNFGAPQLLVEECPAN